MTAQSLLRDLTAQGVILSADGNQLDVDAPDAVLTDELLAMLRARKAELLDLLAEENPEMHDSALFDVIVEVDFYTGERLRIPQEVWPPDWTAPF
jgi:tubulysin polyketide synthase-like protein